MSGPAGLGWTWRDNEVDQAAVAWLIATTFVRFCEDNDLLVGARDRRSAVPPLAGSPVRVTACNAPREPHRVLPGQPHAQPSRLAPAGVFRRARGAARGRALVDPKHSRCGRREISAGGRDGR